MAVVSVNLGGGDSSTGAEDDGNLCGSDDDSKPTKEFDHDWHESRSCDYSSRISGVIVVVDAEAMPLASDE